MKKNDPQTQLVGIVDRLRKTSQNLFSFIISEPEFIARDKGLYAFCPGEAIEETCPDACR